MLSVMTSLEGSSAKYVAADSAALCTLPTVITICSMVLGGLHSEIAKPT